MNLLLIGMPGCGKTAVGKLLAQAMHKPFCDLDTKIEAEQGRSITEIFAAVGEAGFRKLETQALASAADMDAVIATGGGIVVRDENLPLLRRTGLVVFLDRPLADIMADIRTADRPLLVDGKERLQLLQKQRYDRYLAAADLRIENTASLEQAVDKILDEVKKYEDYGDQRAEH